jgi:hypothetical protein
MIVPSILTTAIGAAALIACAALLRYVANEARELNRTRARASDSAKPVSVSSLSAEDSHVPIHSSIANRIDANRRAVIDPNRRGVERRAAVYTPDDIGPFPRAHPYLTPSQGESQPFVSGMRSLKRARPRGG